MKRIILAACCILACKSAAERTRAGCEEQWDALRHVCKERGFQVPWQVPADQETDLDVLASAVCRNPRLSSSCNAAELESLKKEPQERLRKVDALIKTSCEQILTKDYGAQSYLELYEQASNWKNKPELVRGACAKAVQSVRAYAKTEWHTELADAGASDREALTSLNHAQLPIWTLAHTNEVSRAAKQAFEGKECPEVERLQNAMIKDEFERRDRDAKLEPALAACKQTLDTQYKRTAGEIAVVEIPVKAMEYDFNRGVFPLCIGSGEDDRTPYISLFTVLNTEEVQGLLISTDDAFVSIRTRGLGDMTGRGNCSGLALPEAEARAMSARLRSKAHLRMQIAFKPGNWGKTGYRYERLHLEYDGIRADGLGYRIIDDSGVLYPWTPFAI